MKIPKKYQNHLVSEPYEDQDGWWLCLKEESPYFFEGYYAEKTLHEDSQTALMQAFKEHITKGKEKFIAIVRDPKTKKFGHVIADYEKKDQFAKDLRANGFGVKIIIPYMDKDLWIRKLPEAYPNNMSIRSVMVVKEILKTVGGENE